MKKIAKICTILLVLSCLLLLVVHLYVRRFPELVTAKAEQIAGGRTYCLVIQPDHNTNKLKKLKSISEMFFYTVVWRRLMLSEYQRQYYGIPIHFGLICENRGYLWSFRRNKFVENATYHAFLPEKSRFLCRSHRTLSEILHR